MTLTTALSEELNAIVESHAESLGSTPTSALDDLIRRGATQVDWREVRESVEDIRATALDTFAALDALAPHTLATLQLLGHWATARRKHHLRRAVYVQEALSVGRANWEVELAVLDISSNRQLFPSRSSVFRGTMLAASRSERISAVISSALPGNALWTAWSLSRSCASAGVRPTTRHGRWNGPSPV